MSKGHGVPKQEEHMGSGITGDFVLPISAIQGSLELEVLVPK